MKRFIPVVAAISLATAATVFMGCTSDDHAAAGSDHAATAGGNGAFGENPARPGDYNTANNSGRDVSPNHDSGAGQTHTGTAGGNGAFGENPNRPGDYNK